VGRIDISENAMRFRTERLLMTLPLGVIVCFALPGAAWAAQGEGGRSGLLLEIGKFANLFLVVAVLVWVARKPLANFFAGRTQAIRDQLAEAQKARLEAEARLAEIESAMSSLDDELRQIRQTAEKEAWEESRRLIAAAERDAEKILVRARREIVGLTRDAQLDLKKHVAELSVQLAEEKIRHEMTDDDRGRLFTRFIAKVGGRQ
jgi:F-type H+-transporting ATPase subunit b